MNYPATCLTAWLSFKSRRLFMMLLIDCGVSDKYLGGISLLSLLSSFICDRWWPAKFFIGGA